MAELSSESTDIVIVDDTQNFSDRSPASVGPGTTIQSSDSWAGPGGPAMGFVSVRVTRVLSGADLRVGQMIEVLTFGSDVATGHKALHDPAVYLLFLAPYVMGPGQPMDGYGVVGGPAGIFYRCASAHDSSPFSKADAESADLPDEVTAQDVPAAGWTSADYIAAGGPPIG